METKLTDAQTSEYQVENAVRDILLYIGETPDREGLKNTPKRFLKMLRELTQAVRLSNKQIANMFNKTFQDDLVIEAGNSNDIVLIQNIPCFSLCEHHIALMYNMQISVAYLPINKVIGLSKISRIADMVCKRLQLQERICTDIAEIIKLVTGSEDVAVFISAEHSCVTARGIKKKAVTKTNVMRGKFKTDRDLKNQLLLMLK